MTTPASPTQRSMTTRPQPPPSASSVEQPAGSLTAASASNGCSPTTAPPTAHMPGVSRIRTLRPRSHRSQLAVVAANLVVTALVGGAALGFGVGWGWVANADAVAVVAAAAVGATSAGAFVAQMLATQTVVSRTVAIAATVLAWAGITVIVWSKELSAIALLLASSGAVSTVSAVLPRRAFSQWTLAGATATLSARFAFITYRRSTRRVRELRAALRDEEEKALRWETLGRRFARAVPRGQAPARSRRNPSKRTSESATLSSRYGSRDNALTTSGSGRSWWSGDGPTRGCFRTARDTSRTSACVRGPRWARTSDRIEPGPLHHRRLRG